MAWNRGGIGVGDDSVEAAGMGGELQEETGNRMQPGVGGNSKHSLEGSWGGMLGRPGNGERMGRKAGDEVRCHDLKIS
jgi:hypothetical protein